MRSLTYGLILLLAIAHQDFWWRADHTTIVAGFLPVSLAYHIVISIVASVLWGMACRYCWPTDVDVPDEDAWIPKPGGRAH